MEAARAFAARNPGQPALGRLLQQEADRRAAAHYGWREGQSRTREAAEAGRGDSDLRRPRRRRRPSTWLGARRRAGRPPLGRRRRRQRDEPRHSALAQLDAQKIRVFTVGIESSAFASDDLERIAEDTGGTYTAASSAEGLTKVYDELGFQLGNEYLLRYRSNARPDENVDVEVAVVGAEPVSFSYDSPSTRVGRTVRTRVPRPPLPVLGPDPARRRPRARARVFHDPRPLEPPLEQGARRTPGRVRHAPGRRGRRRAAERGRCPPRRGGRQEAAPAQLALDGRVRRGRRHRADRS